MAGSSRSTCVVTGGAGFIGCALSQLLVHRFDEVIVLDKLHPQVHAHAERPESLHEAVEFWHSDITDPEVWDSLLARTSPDCVIHLAAETGTGQSLTDASRHASENVLGTTIMLDAMSRWKVVPGHFVLASSRAVYGEGLWRRGDGEVFYPGPRTRAQLADKAWDVDEATHIPFSAQSTAPRPTSIYGATKLAQEGILESWALAFGSKLTITRLQNVYGPGQSLINSYTGIVSLFVRMAREAKSIPLYEDGKMLRDFVYIDDVASAIMAALDADTPAICRLDVGTGTKATVQDVAEFIAKRYAAPDPHVSGQYRYGDVRHASCDLSATLALLSWQPTWSLTRGLDALCTWIDSELDAKMDARRDHGS